MIEEIIKVVFILLAAVILHEYGHGWTAYKLGDPTAKLLGRLSLNPLRHVDPFGTVILPGILLLLRSMGHDVFVFGWAKPVPVNFMNLHNPKRDMIWVALAGPIMNIAMAIGFSFLLNLDLSAADRQIVSLGILINLLLAIFNMIPIPPLDGSRVVTGLLPYQMARSYSQLEPYGIVILIVLLYFGLFEAVVWPAIRFCGQLLGVVF